MKELRDEVLVSLLARGVITGTGAVALEVLVVLMLRIDEDKAIIVVDELSTCEKVKELLIQTGWLGWRHGQGYDATAHVHIIAWTQLSI